jgi:tetratricopeptide (TPR) repeat protein
LHLRLETFRTPKQIRGGQGRWGDVDHKLTPVFRDRDDLSTGSALGPELQKALAGSEFLLVLCSPASANSRWVNEEIRYFRSRHGDDHILAAIVAGEPGAPVGPDCDGCFPPALIEPPEGSSQPREPIAADFRKGGDGKRLAFLKVAAGMLGIGLDDLARRDAQRRQKQLAAIAAASFGGMIATLGLALYANSQRIVATQQRVIAERERDTATASLNYLISIFEIANPATENPKTITALTILERGKNKIETELSGQPEVQAKLLGAMGEVYANLGESATAKGILRKAIAMPSTSIENRINSQIMLSEILTQTFELDEAETLLNQIDSQLGAAANEKTPAIANLEIFNGRLMERRAEVAVWRANDDDAIMLYGRAKKLFLQSNKDVRRHIARVSTARGMMLAAVKRIDEARVELQDAKKIMVELSGRNHIDTAVSIHNLAFMYFQAGQFDRAAENMAEAVAIYKNVLEPDHRQNSTALLLMGRILQAKGEYRRAAESLTSSVQTAKRVYGETNEKVGFGLLYLSLAQADARDITGALASLDEAQIIYDEKFAAGDFNHGDILVYRAIVLGKAGQKAKAAVLCADGLAILARHLKPEDTYLAEMTDHCSRLTN